MRAMYIEAYGCTSVRIEAVEAHMVRIMFPVQSWRTSYASFLMSNWRKEFRDVLQCDGWLKVRKYMERTDRRSDRRIALYIALKIKQPRHLNGNLQRWLSPDNFHKSASEPTHDGRRKLGRRVPTVAMHYTKSYEPSIIHISYFPMESKPCMGVMAFKPSFNIY